MPNDSRLIETNQPSDLPSVKVFISGEALSGEIQVLSVEVSQYANKIATARVILLDGDAAEQTFKISEMEQFKPGTDIEIKAGYHEEVSSLFKGVLVKHSIKAKKDKPSLLLLEAKDLAIKMTLVRKSAYFYKQKDSEIWESLVAQAGLSKDIEESKVTHPEMVQYDASDWDFLISRAEANGKLVWTRSGQICIKAPDTTSAPVLTLNYGANLLEFEAEMDARKQRPGIKTSAWDMAGQTITSSEAARVSYQEAGNISASDLAEALGLSDFASSQYSALPEAELQSWADAQALKSQGTKIWGRARFQGVFSIKTNQMVEVKGVGARFNGRHLVTGIRHQISKENWEMEAQLGLPDTWFAQETAIQSPPAGGLLPAVSGLQIGQVVQIYGDPLDEDRIQIRLPSISSDEDGTWARVATLDAGKERGSFFRPEPGDEVIVGFVNNDPRQAIVVGGVHSSAHVAPLKATEKNEMKGFQTRSKMKWMFDDEKKIFVLETPAGKKITLDEDQDCIQISDQHQNSIKLSPDGIELNSGKDILLKATGDIKAEGINISQKASAQLTAEGSSGAELKSGGICVVKGSLVQIN
jgi:Rhs element Vgr protein